MIILVTKIATSTWNFSGMTSFYSHSVDFLQLSKFTLNMNFLRTPICSHYLALGNILSFENLKEYSGPCLPPHAYRFPMAQHPGTGMFRDEVQIARPTSEGTETSWRHDPPSAPSLKLANRPPLLLFCESQRVVYIK